MVEIDLCCVVMNDDDKTEVGLCGGCREGNKRGAVLLIQHSEDSNSHAFLRSKSAH